MSTIPLPEHFTSRPAMMGDLGAVLALFNACSMEQVGKAPVEETEMQTKWESSHFNLETDTQKETSDV